MKRVIDLAADNFERCNFEEAEILGFDYLDKSFDDIEFKIWGARLLVDDFWEHDKSFLPGVSHEDDYYVAGEGTIKIQQALGFELCFAPYKEFVGAFRFICDPEGKIIEKKRTRGKLGEGDIYLWECTSACPHGFVRLKICACGEVNYEFHDEDMIAEKEFLQNPLKYSCGKRTTGQ